MSTSFAGYPDRSRWASFRPSSSPAPSHPRSTLGSATKQRVAVGAQLDRNRHKIQRALCKRNAGEKPRVLIFQEKNGHFRTRASSSSAGVDRPLPDASTTLPEFARELQRDRLSQVSSINLQPNLSFARSDSPQPVTNCHIPI